MITDITTDTEQFTKLSLGKVIDLMYDTRERYREASKATDAIKKELDTLEKEILSRLDSEDMIKANGHKAVAIISENEVPNADDWDTVLNHIRDHNLMYLLQKRLSATACRELHEQGEEIPGLHFITVRSVNLRKA